MKPFFSKKSCRSALSLLMAMAILLCSWPMAVQGAPLGIDWFAGQNGNPWTGSPYTFEYYANGAFQKMEAFNAIETRWQTTDGAAFVDTWFATATHEKYAAVVYHASTAGTAAITNGFALQLEGACVTPAEFIVLQSDGTGFAPLYPAKGTWSWQTVTAGQQIPFPQIQTYLNSGDLLYFVLRAKNVGESTSLTSGPQVDFAAAPADTGVLRPAEFTQFGGMPVLPSTTYNSSWYINNRVTNNYTDDNPFAYLKGAGGTYTDLLPNRKQLDASNYAWTDAGEASPWIGPWFISAGTGVDGAAEFTCALDGVAVVSSAAPLKIDQTGLSDGFEFIIVQKNSEGKYYPLYPTAGQWLYKSFDDLTPPATPSVSTGVEAGDKLLYIVKSTGTPNNDTLTIDPKVTLTPGATGTARPADFSVFGGEPAYPAVTYVNSWYVNNRDTNNHTDDSPFAYLKGSEGVYNDLLPNRKNFSGTNYAWTDANDAAPWVGPWFLSAGAGVDGIIEFTAPVSGTLEISSDAILEFEQKGLSDGASLIVVQKNAAGHYYPLYPHKGIWQWLDVRDNTSISMGGVKTGVIAGDKVLFVLKSTGNSIHDTVTLGPRVTTYEGSPEAARPTDFTSWPTDNGGGPIPPEIIPDVYNNSWYVNNQTTNNRTDSNPFAYLAGAEGNYNTLLPNRKNFSGSNYAWTNPQDAAPWVGPWFVSATTGIDGVVEYTVPSDGKVTVQSGQLLSMGQKGESDGMSFMVALQSADGKFAPLYPKRDVWSWQRIDDGSSLPLDVTVGVKAGDRILYITHSTGNSVHDTVNLDPKILMYAGAADAARPTVFSGWKATESSVIADGSSISHIHSWYIANVKTNSRTDDSPFAYLKGSKGVYDELLPNRKNFSGDHYAWTEVNDAAPWAGPWFLSANTGVDGVIEYTVSSKGTLQIESSFNLSMGQKEQSDGAGFMIVQKDKSGGYYPLFPQKGGWDWQVVNDTTDIKINIKTGVNAGDTILFVLNSTGTPIHDTINLDPKMTLTTSGTQEKRPSSFEAWNAQGPKLDPNNITHSQCFTPDSPENGPFSCLGGYDGVYESLDYFREDWNAWTRGGAPPSVGINYISGTVENDAVLSYAAQDSGLLKIGSKIPLKLGFPNECDGVNFIVVLKTAVGEHPLWPKKGEWEYFSFKGDTSVELKDLSAYVRLGDEIHFICRSVGSANYDTIDIDPVMVLDTSVPDDGEMLPAIKRKTMTAEDYALNLLTIDGLSIDRPASERAGKTGIFAVKPVHIVLISLGGLVVLAAAAAVFFMVRRKKRGAS